MWWWPSIGNGRYVCIVMVLGGNEILMVNSMLLQCMGPYICVHSSTFFYGKSFSSNLANDGWPIGNVVFSYWCSFIYRYNNMCIIRVFIDLQPVCNGQHIIVWLIPTTSEVCPSLLTIKSFSHVLWVYILNVHSCHSNT